MATIYIVSAGSSLSNITVSAGDQVLIEDGGQVSGLTVLSGGLVSDAGGSFASSIISSGGEVVVESGTTSNGVATALTFGSGAVEVISAGGTSINDTISGGVQFISSGGFAVIATVEAGGVQVVSSGGSATHATLDATAMQAVYSGGAAYGTDVDSGATLNVFSGGLVSGADLDGVAFVYAGGTALDTEVGADDSGILVVLPGADVTGTTIDPGGQVVSTGVVVTSADGSAETFGTTAGATIGSGTTDYVLPGGVAFSSLIASGGRQIVVSGGSAITTTVSGGTEIVSAGGTSVSPTVSAGGVEIIVAGGVATFATVGSGGAFEVIGGTASGTIVSATGLVLVEGDSVNSGITSNTDVASGGTEVVVGGGVTSNTTVEDGGYSVISNGGNSYYAEIESGGRAELYNGGGAWYATIDDGGALYVSAGSVAVSATIADGGLLSLLGGEERFARVQSGGTEGVLNGGVASFTDIESGGSAIVFAGGTALDATIDGGALSLTTGATALDTITFEGTGGLLELDDNTSVPAATVISGFTTGDTISFGLETYAPTDSYSVSGDTVTVTTADTTYTLTIAGATADGYYLTKNADGDLVLAVCYYPGTLITTPEGAAAVESLAQGDLVTTADGRVLPVRWIGRNTVSTRFGDPLSVLPIRIKAGALAENQPARDLLVSPEHALLVDGLLIQAAALVNGRSITREARVPERFVYYHVELAEHALILAEGTPAETFVDNIQRRAFDNWAEHEALFDSTPIREMDRPRILSARQVPETVHARLARRAGILAKADIAA